MKFTSEQINDMIDCIEVAMCEGQMPKEYGEPIVNNLTALLGINEFGDEYDKSLVFELKKL